MENASVKDEEGIEGHVILFGTYRTSDSGRKAIEFWSLRQPIASATF
jgi:hypothetical protein